MNMAAKSIALPVSNFPAQEASMVINTRIDDSKRSFIAIRVPNPPTEEVSKTTNTDADDFKGAFVVVRKGPPIKEIGFVIVLLLLGLFGIAFGLYMVSEKMGGGVTNGILFTLLGMVMFIPGFYYSRIAWYAYKGYKGFSFSNIPAV